MPRRYTRTAPGNTPTGIPRGDRAAYTRRYRRANPDKRKEWELRAVYRLEYDDYLAMVAQGCAVCPRSFEGAAPHVDHDHSCQHPGKGFQCCRACVRGVVCQSCNIRIGAFEAGRNRDPDIAVYLGRPGALVPQPRNPTLF